MKINKMFPDEKLAQYVATKLKLDVNSELPSINRLSVFNLYNTGITNIEGIQVFEHLKNLDLGYNSIEDISTLSNLKKIRKLRLENTKIKDFSPLSDLVSLQQLNLIDTKIKDLNCLSNCENLQTLFLNEDCDLTTLPKLENLKVLHIGSHVRTHYFCYRDISSNAQKLKYFLDYDSKIGDYSFITNLPNLENLGYPKNEEI